MAWTDCTQGFAAGAVAALYFFELTYYLFLVMEISANKNIVHANVECALFLLCAFFKPRKCIYFITPVPWRPEAAPLKACEACQNILFMQMCLQISALILGIQNGRPNTLRHQLRLYP